MTIMETHSLLVELLVEELPPKALEKLGKAFAGVLFEGLKTRGLTSDASQLTMFASPRRLAAHVTKVASQAADKPQITKLMAKSAAFDSDGAPTQALLKKTANDPRCAALLATWPVLSNGSEQLFLDGVGKAEALFYKSMETGKDIRAGLQRALSDAIDALPIPKLMTYQLEPDPSRRLRSVSFVRPVHGLVALHGADPVPVQALGLTAQSNVTQGHRFECHMPVAILNADSYEAQMRDEGKVIASFATRRADIAGQLQAKADVVGNGVRPIDDPELLDEVTGLVEWPKVLLCEFEPEFLAVPQECLILTMKANQKYFPLLDAHGKLTNKFLVVSNINPKNPSAVISGNERVVRPRLADAKFFFDQDRKKTLELRVPELVKVTYHNKLGSQHQRMVRVRAIAEWVAGRIGADAALAGRAAYLAKADLLTDMVGEFPELQGIMGGYYARHDGEDELVAEAIEDQYLLQRERTDLVNSISAALDIADRTETLVGIWGIGLKPTGEKDPFALRRHALSLINRFELLTLASELEGEKVTLHLPELLEFAVSQFPAGLLDQQTPVDLTGFIYDRFHHRLVGLGEQSIEIVDAVLSQRPPLQEVVKRIRAVMAFAALPEAPALAAANKRIGNILKKAEKADAHVSDLLLKEEAEKALYTSMQEQVPQADAQFDAGDYTASLQTLAALRGPVDAFFDSVMVNAEEADLRLNRLGLLATLHRAMNRVADLSRLAA